ncbi:MAG: DUF29 domain-containing protein [Bryobacteraceae bacterium]|nr:DUF29 domain-containing protein [Bryobacteraceae bacterium]
MAVETPVKPNTKLFSDDYVAWAEETARFIREGLWDEIDREILLEEVHGLASVPRMECDNRLSVLICHLLKWRYQGERRGNSWRRTIQAQRVSLRKLLRRSPTLRAEFDSAVTDAFPVGRLKALNEMNAPDERIPEEPVFTAEQVLDDNYYPE